MGAWLYNYLSCLGFYNNLVEILKQSVRLFVEADILILYTKWLKKAIMMT